MLIVIEGLDGAGKSTQVRMLKEYVSRAGRNFKYIHFPRFDAPVYGELLAKFLRGEFGPIDGVHPQLVALLFAEDRHSAAEEIRSALERGEIVILDRYVYSNIAFQCAKIADTTLREELRRWILETEYTIFGIPVPDVNIFLDVPISFVCSRLSASRKGNDRNYLQGKEDIHEADLEFQKRVREVYLQQIGLDSSFIRVDCSDDNGGMLPSQVIFAKIRQLLKSM